MTPNGIDLSRHLKGGRLQRVVSLPHCGDALSHGHFYDV
jgi:hypothetical protein